MNVKRETTKLELLIMFNKYFNEFDLKKNSY